MGQATLNGQIIADGGEPPCTAWFEWGTSIRYGSETPPQGNLSTGMTFSATIFGLAEGVVYHYRAVAINSSALTYGNDSVFTLPVGSLIPVMLDDAGLYQFLEVP